MYQTYCDTVEFYRSIYAIIYQIPSFEDCIAQHHQQQQQQQQQQKTTTTTTNKKITSTATTSTTAAATEKTAGTTAAVTLFNIIYCRKGNHYWVKCSTYVLDH